MMSKLYLEVIVSYDIENTKSRKNLYESLKDLSLLPIQKSVFWGFVKPPEENVIHRLFIKYCKNKDKAFCLRVDFANQVNQRSIGYKENEFPKKPILYQIL